MDDAGHIVIQRPRESKPHRRAFIGSVGLPSQAGYVNHVQKGAVDPPLFNPEDRYLKTVSRLLAQSFFKVGDKKSIGAKRPFERTSPVKKTDIGTFFVACFFKPVKALIACGIDLSGEKPRSMDS